jgi:hypothetical protein
MIVDAPWNVLNTVIQRDLQIPTVKEEIRVIELPDKRQLRRHLPNGLPTRLLV